MEFNSGIAVCETDIEVLSYVAYVRVGDVLPYGRENCVSPFDEAKREQVLGTVVHSPDPKENLFFSSSKPRHTHLEVK
jgi:ribulose bisphosphate carboxylase small subunit